MEDQGMFKPLKDFSAAEVAPQSGAAVRQNSPTLDHAGFKLVSNRVTPGGPMMATATTVYEKDGITLTHEASMGGERWTIGAAVRGMDKARAVGDAAVEAMARARPGETVVIDVRNVAVRGEAVAEAWKYRTKGSDRWLVTMQEGWVKSLEGAEVIPLVPAAAPVAAGESSDVMVRFEKWKAYPLPALNSDGHFDKDWLHREFVAFKAGMASIRAADALDSKPTDDEPTERETLIACLGDDAVTLLRANPDDEMAQTMREAAAMLENDGELLASQFSASKTPNSIVDDARFMTLLNEANYTASEASVCGNDFGTGDKAQAAEDALVAYIDSRAPAAQAASVARDESIPWNNALEQAAALVLNCDPRANLRGIATAIRGLKSPQQEGSEAGNG